jgi:hypothetical protein
MVLRSNSFKFLQDGCPFLYDPMRAPIGKHLCTFVKVPDSISSCTHAKWRPPLEAGSHINARIQPPADELKHLATRHSALVGGTLRRVGWNES